MADERTRYSDAELEEFKQLILKKLENARADYELLRATITHTGKSPAPNPRTVPRNAPSGRRNRKRFTFGWTFFRILRASGCDFPYLIPEKNVIFTECMPGSAYWY